MHTTRRTFLQTTALAALAPDVFAQARPTKVVLLLAGVINDGGWSQLAFEGIERLQRDSRFFATYAENISIAQTQQVARGYADDGFDLILGHGFEFSSALLDIAPDYPRQSFFVTSFLPAGRIPPNLLFVNMGYLSAAYAAGALAALISVHRRAVGFVGGNDDPNQQRMRRAFIAGAQQTVPGVRGLGILTGDYDNPARGREAASTLIGAGADVLWHTADVTGLGVIQAVARSPSAAGLKVIGCYSDQTALAPQHMATSFLLNLAGMVTTAAEATANRTFSGGVEWRPPTDAMWLLRAGNHGLYNPALVPAAAWATFQTLWHSLAQGKVDIPAAVAAL